MPGEDKDEPIAGFAQPNDDFKSEAAFAADFEAERRGADRPFVAKKAHDADCPKQVLPEAGGICMCGFENSKPEAINHPAHYNVGGIEVVDIADAYDLGRYEFNVVKYVLRAKHKGNELEDLHKARWYLDRRIEILEKTSA